MRKLGNQDNRHIMFNRMQVKLEKFGFTFKQMGDMHWWEYHKKGKLIEAGHKLTNQQAVVAQANAFYKDYLEKDRYSC